MPTEEEIKNAQLQIIDGQLFGSIAYIVVLIIAIILILNERKNTLNETGFLTVEESQNLALFNKVLVLILVVYFLYLSYKSYELAEKTNQETKYLEMQIFAALLTIIVALIGFYVVYANYQATTFRISEIENPEI